MATVSQSAFTHNSAQDGGAARVTNGVLNCLGCTFEHNLAVGRGGAIFAGTQQTQTVWESHNDEVHVVPEGFFITAGSASCKVQGMENEAGDRFGLQFHPEVNDSEFGKEMFENFVALCRARRNG